MAAVDNHYEFLGLDPSASHAELEAAIQNVSEQAIRLVYTSPQRSADLWEQIRHMRRDLLATPEGRQVYDEALRRSKRMTGGDRTAQAGFGEVFRQPEAEVRVARPPSTESPRSVAMLPVDDDDESRGIAWPYALIAAAAVLIAVAGALVAREPGVTPTRRPVAMTLSQSGAVHGSKFVSGGSVTLTWTTVPGASLYHLQVATAPGDPSDVTVFGHGSTRISVTRSSYKLRVTGSQIYYWRVQARIGKTWQRYTASHHFAVAKPSLPKPVALAPVRGIVQGGKHAQLCWTAVPHAVGYRLRVQGQPTRTVSGTCLKLTLQPRTYHWSVAALVRGVGVYTGAYSVAEVLHVRPAQRTSHRSHVARHSARPVARSHTNSKRRVTVRRVTVSSRKGSSAPAPVEVAAAMPATRFITPNATRAKSTILRAAISSIRRRTASVNRTTTTTRRIPFRVHPGQTGAATVRHTPARVSNTGATGYVPHPTSAPIKRHTPVVSSTASPGRMPAPPAPPARPSITIGAAAAQPVSTKAVATAKASATPTGIVLRPIVAAQVPTRSSANPTSTRPVVTYPVRQATPTSPAPVIRPTSPIPTATKPIVPTSTPVQSTPHGKPDDPTHPDHPVHPVHPVHPTHP